MHIALLEVHRRGITSPELITFTDEQSLAERLTKLTATDNVERVKIFRLAETLTKQVSFSST